MTIKFLTPERLKKLNVQAVFSLVETAYGYEPGTLLRNRGHYRHLTHPRHLAIFLLVKSGMGYSELGRALKRDFSGIIHSFRFIQKAAAADPEVSRLVDEMVTTIAEDPQKFRLHPRIKSVLGRPGKNYSARRPSPPRPAPILPNVATLSIPGMEELDRLIMEGRGDRPRIPLAELERNGQKKIQTKSQGKI
jgi:hypothetical protein